MKSAGVGVLVGEGGVGGISLLGARGGEITEYKTSIKE